MAREYTHVVIDKTNRGLNILRNEIHQRGLQTAQALGIQLAQGSVKLEHHVHIFLWDDTAEGIKGQQRLEAGGNCFTVRVRWPDLTQSGAIFAGTLLGDGGHAGPPSGKSPNGAWAYKGNIPRYYCFIEGLDSREDPGYGEWQSGRGWKTVIDV